VNFLVGIEHVAHALVGVREWLPNLKDITGRGIEVRGFVKGSCCARVPACVGGEPENICSFCLATLQVQSNRVWLVLALLCAPRLLMGICRKALLNVFNRF